MSFWKLFKPKSCSIDLKSGSKEEVLHEIVAALVAGGSLPEQHSGAAISALMAREALGSTGVGMKVAIPHVKIPGIDRAIGSLSVHAAGVEWAAVDGDPVHVFVTILRPLEPSDEHDPEVHLEMMRWISRLARERDFRHFALQAKTRTELVDLLKEMSHV